MRSVFAVLAVCALGTASLWLGTDGLRAFTAEGARRLAVQERPRALPAAVLQDQDGRAFRLQDYQGRVVLVEFIYTRCLTVCSSLGASFQQLYRRLPAQGRADVVLLSISFDPRHDDPARLRDYARRYGADGRRWRIARINDPVQLQALLKAFGVTVIPDTYGGFEHNAAIHVLNRGGRLAAIHDPDDVPGALRRARALP